MLLLLQHCPYTHSLTLPGIGGTVPTKHQTKCFYTRIVCWFYIWPQINHRMGLLRENGLISSSIAFFRTFFRQTTPVTTRYIVLIDLKVANPFYPYKTNICSKNELLGWFGLKQVHRCIEQNFIWSNKYTRLGTNLIIFFETYLALTNKVWLVVNLK